MRKKVAFIIWMSILCLPVFAEKISVEKPFTVVIDAGHGGKDPGAVGKIVKEKDLNLTVALRAGRLIEEAYPDVRVLFTRKTDEFITLQGRADFVNKNNADLFICIHTNSAENRSVSGAEVYVLGTEKMDANLDVAMRENAVIKLESDYQTKYQGFDPNSIDSYIMFELMQNRYMDRSLHFAELVQHQFVDSLRRVDRGVRQAAFWVLHKSACPSVLVEMGFISNQDEEKYLASPKGQESIAQSVAKAFSMFMPKREIEVPSPAVAQEAAPVEDKPEVAPVEDKPEVATPRYAVQIAACRNPLPQGDPALMGLRCECIRRGDWYKYVYGASEDKAAVEQTMRELRLQFPDCFVVKL